MHAGLTAANFVAVVSAIIVMVTLGVPWDAGSVRAGELGGETSSCTQPGGIIISTSTSEKLGLVKEHFKYYFAVVCARRPRWNGV